MTLCSFNIAFSGVKWPIDKDSVLYRNFSSIIDCPLDTKPWNIIAWRNLVHPFAPSQSVVVYNCFCLANGWMSFKESLIRPTSLLSDLQVKSIIIGRSLFQGTIWVFRKFRAVEVPLDVKWLPTSKVVVENTVSLIRIRIFIRIS